MNSNEIFPIELFPEFNVLHFALSISKPMTLNFCSINQITSGSPRKPNSIIAIVAELSLIFVNNLFFIPPFLLLKLEFHKF